MKLQIAFILLSMAMIAGCTKDNGPAPEPTTTIVMPPTTIEVPATTTAPTPSPEPVKDGVWCHTGKAAFGPCWNDSEFKNEKCVTGKTMPGHFEGAPGCTQFECKDTCQ